MAAKPKTEPTPKTLRPRLKRPHRHSKHQGDRKPYRGQGR